MGTPHPILTIFTEKDGQGGFCNEKTQLTTSVFFFIIKIRSVDSGQLINVSPAEENPFLSTALKVVFVLTHMLTKEQKKKVVARGEDVVGTAKHILFADFTGVPTAELRKLRILMRELGGTFTVLKKRLLRIALKNKGIDCDPTKFERQAGLITVSQDIYSAAAKIYALVKELARTKKDLKILGGVDIEAKKELSAEEFVTIAQLPSRETLLTQIAFMLTMPMKKIMVGLQKIAKVKN